MIQTHHRRPTKIETRKQKRPLTWAFTQGSGLVRPVGTTGFEPATPWPPVSPEQARYLRKPRICCVRQVRWRPLATVQAPTGTLPAPVSLLLLHG